MNEKYLSQIGAEPDEPHAMGLAIASMIIGIISYATLNPMGAILAIIFAGSAKRHGNNTGFSTAGLACGIVGLILSIIAMALLIAGAVIAFDASGMSLALGCAYI